MDHEREMGTKNQSSQPLKKMIPQLLISVSLFSFLISYSSLYNSSFPSSLVYSSPKFHHYFSPNSFHILGHALNKNCLFLICNGLLVFLAKTSGFIQPPAGHDTLQTALDKYLTDGGKTADEPKQVSIFIAESEEEDEGEAPLPRRMWTKIARIYLMSQVAGFLRMMERSCTSMKKKKKKKKKRRKRR